MGGLAVIPALSSVAGVASTAAGVLGAVNTVQKLVGRDRGADLSAQQNAQQAALQQQQLQLQQQQADDERRQALRRAMARTRAQLGANNALTSGGSGEAVLLGMFQESEAEQQRRVQLDNLRQNALAQDVAQANQRNLLQQQENRTRQIFAREFLNDLS